MFLRSHSNIHHLFKGSASVSWSRIPKRYRSVAESGNDNHISEITKQSECARYLRTPQLKYLEHDYQREYAKVLGYSLLPLALSPICCSVIGIPFPPVLDYALGTTILGYVQYHALNAIGKFIPKACMPRYNLFARYTLYITTTFGLYGLYLLETQDNGVIHLIKKPWKKTDLDAMSLTT